jgi:hypothetical protein
MKKILLVFFLSWCCHSLAFAQYREALASNGSFARSEARQTQTLPLKDGINVLVETFEVSIAFKDELVSGKVVPSFPKSYATVEQGLKELLQGTDLDFEKAGKKSYVVFQKKGQNAKSRSNTPNPVFFASTRSTGDLPQPLTQRSFQSNFLVETMAQVTGKVMDENGDGFPGVNILVKGTAIGAVTDINGKYSIAVPDNSGVLVFSFVLVISIMLFY